MHSIVNKKSFCCKILSLDEEEPSQDGEEGHVEPDDVELEIRDEDEGRPASSLSKKVEIEVLLGEIFIFEKS